MEVEKERDMEVEENSKTTNNSTHVSESIKMGPIDLTNEMKSKEDDVRKLRFVQTLVTSRTCVKCTIMIDKL